MLKDGAIVFILALMLLASNVSAFEYINTYYITGGSGTSIETDPVPFFSENGDVVLNLNMRSSFNTSSSISYNGNFLSPYSAAPFGITSGTVTTNQTCLNLGTAIKTYTAGQVIESRAEMTNDADSATIYSQSTFNVTTTDRFLRLFSNNNTDSEGFVPNIYRDLSALATEPPTTGEITVRFVGFEDCGITQTLSRFPGSYTPAAQQEFGYVVVNSTAGIINYSMAVGAPAPNSRFVYYPLDDASAVTDLGTGLSKSGSVTLDQNRLYVFAYGTVGVGSARSAPSMNFTIDLGLPNYVCPAFSECIDGFQERICVDANGLQPNLIETQSCSVIVLENLTLGFEESTFDTNVFQCEPQWGIFGCGYTIGTINGTGGVSVPANWTIVDGGVRDYFLQMVDEWATEGSRSLKMWVVPPKLGEPNSAGNACINLTFARSPQILRGINDSLFIENNITFPAENMLISYDVKACTEQVLHHSALQDTVSAFGVNLTTITFCPERCYAESCTTQPKGNYIFNINDPIDGTSLIGTPFYDESQLITKSLSFPLTGINVSRTYNLVFATIPENPLDRSGQCFLVDNVRYEVLQEPITENVVPGCVSRCINQDFYQASELPNGECRIAIIATSQQCVDSETATAIENLESYCLDDDTLNVFNPKTGKYEGSDCTAGLICFRSACVTEEEAAADDSTQPAEDTTAFLVWFNFLFSPLFIFFIISFVIAGVVAAGLAGKKSDGKGRFEIFGTVMIIMVIIGTLPGIEIIPIWVSIAIIVFISLMMAQIMGIFAGRK